MVQPTSYRGEWYVTKWDNHPFFGRPEFFYMAVYVPNGTTIYFMDVLSLYIMAMYVHCQTEQTFIFWMS